MDKVIISLFLILLACSTFADSDLTGIYAGTYETIPIVLTNSTGYFYSVGNCTIRILYNFNVVVNYTMMTNLGGGLYYYNWSVPSDTGLYVMLFNCSTTGLENYTKAGSAYVVARSFEKSVANGVFKYSEQASEKYGFNWWNNLIYYVLLILGIIIIGFVAYLIRRG